MINDEEAWNCPIALYALLRALTKAELPISNFSNSFSSLVKALVTLIPVIDDSKAPLISETAIRDSIKAFFILFLITIETPTIKGTTAKRIKDK